MARITALLLGICAALALGTSTARAGAWQFVETSCTPVSSPPLACSEEGTPTRPIMLPKVVATFSSPDLTGSYQFKDDPQIPGPPPVGESGDRNFSFQWAAVPPVFAPGNSATR